MITEDFRIDLVCLLIRLPPFKTSHQMLQLHCATAIRYFPCAIFGAITGIIHKVERQVGSYPHTIDTTQTFTRIFLGLEGLRSRGGSIELAQHARGGFATEHNC